MVRNLFFIFLFISAFSQVKAQEMGDCNMHIQSQVELVIKNVLSLDSICSYISDENNSVILIFCFDDNFNIDSVKIYTKARFNTNHISMIQEDLKKIKIHNDCIEYLKSVRKFYPGGNLKFFYKPKI